MRRLLVAIAIASCSTFDSSDAPPAGTDAGTTDASAADAAAEDAATPDVVAADSEVPEAGTGYVLFDGFESGQGCAGWAPNTGTAFPENTPHTGNRSCRVCFPSANGYIQKFVAADGGGTFTGLLYVRIPDDAGTDGGALFALQAYDSMNVTAGYGDNTLPSASTTWQPMQPVMIPDASTAGVLMKFGLVAAGCVLVDDVSLAHE